MTEHEIQARRIRRILRFVSQKDCSKELQRLELRTETKIIARMR